MSESTYLNKEILGDTLLKYQEIATILNSFPIDEPITIETIASHANVHWKTAKKALVFFDLACKIVPNFSIDKEFKIKIIEKPEAMKAIDVHFEAIEMKILTKMMLKKIINKEKGYYKEDLNEFLQDKEIQHIYSLIEKGYLNSEEGLIYLSNRGKILANRGIDKIISMGYKLPWEEEKDKKSKPKKICINNDYILYNKEINKIPFSFYKEI